jgi:hypothetical protein
VLVPRTSFAVAPSEVVDSLGDGATVSWSLRLQFMLKLTPPSLPFSVPFGSDFDLHS